MEMMISGWASVKQRPAADGACWWHAPPLLAETPPLLPMMQVAILQEVYNDMVRHTAQAPPVQEAVQHSDHLDRQYAQFWAAKAEYHSARKSKSAKLSVVVRAEQRLSEERCALQTLRRQDEELQQRLLRLSQDHYPELPLLHAKVRWLREALCGDHTMPGVLLSDREMEEYDPISCWTQV